jgi:hypothetical protein
MDSDAIVVARWAWPGNIAAEGRVFWTPGNIAAVEALIVERGMGQQYGEHLCRTALSPIDPFPRGWDDIAAIRTAPPATILRALAATIRAQGKETT